MEKKRQKHRTKHREFLSFASFFFDLSFFSGLYCPSRNVFRGGGIGRALRPSGLLHEFLGPFGLEVLSGPISRDIAIPGHICAIPPFAKYCTTKCVKPPQKKKKKLHRVLQGTPPRGRQLYFTFPSAPDPLFKASRAPFLTLRVATPSGAPRQAPLEYYRYKYRAT